MQVKPRVLVSVACMGSIRKELAATLIAISRDDRFEIDIRMQAERPYEHSLNMLALQAIGGEYDWWLTFDDDQCPVNNPLDLIGLDLDVVSCPAPMWNPVASPSCPVIWSAWDEAKDGYRVHTPLSGLQECHIVSSGALLMARRVFSTIESPFLIEWDDKGRKLAGPDISFCRRARANGFRIWAHFDYPCRHYVNVDMAEVGTWIASNIMRKNNG